MSLFDYVDYLLNGTGELLGHETQIPAGGFDGIPVRVIPEGLVPPGTVLVVDGRTLGTVTSFRATFDEPEDIGYKVRAWETLRHAELSFPLRFTVQLVDAMGDPLPDYAARAWRRFWYHPGPVGGPASGWWER